MLIKNHLPQKKNKLHKNLEIVLSQSKVDRHGFGVVITRVSISVKKHHIHSSSYKETFDWSWLTVSEVCPLSS